MNKQSRKWEPNCKRFVAFFDIMGFKDFVARKSHKDLYEAMSKISKNIKQIESIKENEFPAYAGETHISTFSDSIIIFSKDNSPESFNIFSIITAWLFQSIIYDTFPIKGAIAHGEITVNKSNRIYFGQPIIDAYELQEEVFYYGIVAHHSIEEYLKKNSEPDLFNQIYFDVPTPLKSGNIKHYNIDWFNYDLNPEKDTDSLKNKALEKIKNFRINTSGRPRKYIDNTIEMIKEKKSNYVDASI